VLALLSASVAPVAAQPKMVTLTVSVVDQGGNPVGDVTLHATWSNGSTERTTASNGKAFVDVPKGADVSITVSHPDYVRNSPYTLQDASERDVTVRVARKGSLAVSVDDSDGAVSGAQVTVSQGGTVVSQGETAADGSYRTGDIEQGSYTVAVSKPGYYHESQKVTVDGDVQQSISLRSGSVVLEFSVVDDHYEQAGPVGNASIRVGSVGTVNTLENGEATARVPVNTALQIRTSKPDYRTTTTDLQVGESDRQVNLTISRTPTLTLNATSRRVVAGERVSITLMDAYGDPAAGAAVLLDGNEVGQTNDNGEFAPQIPDAGNHTLQARKGDVASNEVVVEAISDAASKGTTTQTTTEATTATTTQPTTTQETTATGLRGFTMIVTGIAVLLVALALLAWWRR